MKFQSTRPVWGATCVPRGGSDAGEVSIHAPRVGRDIVARQQEVMQYVSIHAPRVGRDAGCRRLPRHIGRFNPRAPCGARRRQSPSSGANGKFQSTRPVWGATEEEADKLHETLVSIHAPRVGRDSSRCSTVCSKGVSIHAPRVGRDHP